MSHINGDTLNTFKSIHNSIHHLLKDYHENQTVTDEELVIELESIKNTCGQMITDWKDYLGHK